MILYYTDLEITLFVNLVNEVTARLITGETQAQGNYFLTGGEGQNDESHISRRPP